MLSVRVANSPVRVHRTSLHVTATLKIEEPPAATAAVSLPAVASVSAAHTKRFVHLLQETNVTPLVLRVIRFDAACNEASEGFVALGEFRKLAQQSCKDSRVFLRCMRCEGTLYALNESASPVCSIAYIPTDWALSDVSSAVWIT